MAAIEKFMMLQYVVKDMPKSKQFYADKLGLKVTADYRQSDEAWWVSLGLPEGGVTVTLTTFNQKGMTPGIQVLYFGAKDLESAHKEFSAKGVDVTDIKNDLHGPGSGTKFFQLHDPDNNLIHIEQI
jgi:catechol 2,3-dioxygenase-like lactoylglutathione lyase family enzyme